MQPDKPKHYYTMPKTLLSVLTKINADPLFSNLILVGGAAVSLQIGHRKCNDIDLFSESADLSFHGFRFGEHIKNYYNPSEIISSEHGVFAHIEGVKTDILKMDYNFTKPPVIDAGIRIAHLDDLSAMKLYAIYQRRTNLSDFVDIAYLSGTYSLNKMLRNFNTMYDEGGIYDDKIKALLKTTKLDDKNIKHSNIELTKGSLNFNAIEERLKAMTANPELIFPKIEMPHEWPKNIVEDLENKPPSKKYGI